jgi:hypothetical protein
VAAGANPGGNSSLLGILNATSCAGVDSTGKTDSTVALQGCIERAYKANLALFFAPGRYLVSDTLTVAQGDISPAPGSPVNTVPCRFRANVLLGSTARLPARPTIVLRASSPGFNATTPKNVMKITNPRGEDINMNQVIRGIDFRVEPGNPGAIALFFHGAQGGVIQDVSVRLSPDSFAGFGGGGGAGTSHFGVSVHGGVHGAYFLESEPAAVLGNARFIGQSGSAIVFWGQGPLVVVGVHIVRPGNASGAAIATPVQEDQCGCGQISVVDTIVECRGSSEPALASNASVTVKGMWTSGCSMIVHQPGSRHSALLASDAGSGWSVVHEMARGIDTISHSGNDRLTMDVIYKDNERVAGGTVANVSVAVAGPPSTVLSQHILWDEATFPSFEEPTTVNAVEQCGVQGDGLTDDEPALSACLKQHQDVFLPKGHYRLGRTLELNAEQRLIGLSQTHSVLMPATTGLANASSEAKPLVTTAVGSGATIAFLGINSWWHLPVFTLQWRSKGGLWRSNYETRVCECMWLSNFREPTTPCTKAIPLNVPKTQIHGTGSFVNYVSDEDILMTDIVNYRHLHVSGAGTRANSSDRIRFYELNLEHSQAQANSEVSNSSHIDVYGLKLEGSTTVMWIRDSHDVNLWGLGGAGDSFPGDPVDWKGTFHNVSYDFNVPADLPRYNASTIRIERTDKYKMANLINDDRGAESLPISQIHPVPLTAKLLSHFPWPAVDVPLIIASEWTPWPGWKIPPSLWSVVGEMDGMRDTAARLSKPLDRPVLFQRG